jgi:signal peptidase I
MKRYAHKGARYYVRFAFRMLERALAVTGVILLFYHTCFELSVVTSGSMSPTLLGACAETGDLVLAERISYWFGEPERWDVVSYFGGNGMMIMKRVVGLPGETVIITNNWILIDGEELERRPEHDFLNYYAFGDAYGGRPFTCTNGYYVLGDHSCNSYDSRYEGQLDGDKILARAWLVVWPPARIGFVN